MGWNQAFVCQKPVRNNNGKSGGSERALTKPSNPFNNPLTILPKKFTIYQKNLPPELSIIPLSAIPSSSFPSFIGNIGRPSDLCELSLQ